jgi:uncharacterized protein with NRDE domain
MCVLALAWNSHPKWRLVVAGNRDELHDRPAAPLRRWEDPNAALLAGQDLRSGGTWLGVSEQGRFAVVTNLRGYEATIEGRPSRGVLLTDILSGRGPYASPSPADLADFNPLNLLTAQQDQLIFSTNQPAPDQHILPDGLYGLSNGALDEPWPKTVRLKAALTDWLARDAAPPTDLLTALAEDVPPPPDTTALPIFIRNPLYGTRCSSVVAIGHDGAGLFLERRFNAQGEPTGDTALSFAWAVSPAS